MLGISSAHNPLSWPNLFISSPSMTLLAASTCPFIWGRSTLVTRCFIPSPLRNCSRWWSVNCLPFSVTTLCGNLWRQMTCFHKKFCTLSRYSRNRLDLYPVGDCPLADGNSPKISTPHWLKGHGEEVWCIFSGGALKIAPYRWHSWHFLV